jgi:hypothetical protein
MLGSRRADGAPGRPATSLGAGWLDLRVLACLATSFPLGSSRRLLPPGFGSARNVRGSVAAAAPAGGAVRPCWLLRCRARAMGRHGTSLGRGRLQGTAAGMRSAGRVWRLVRRVGLVGQQPAGGRAPVDRAGRPAPLLSPGDPALPVPRRCRLGPWAWSLLHRVLLHLCCRSGWCGGGPAASEVDWLADWGGARRFVILTPWLERSPATMIGRVASGKRPGPGAG